MQKEKDIVFLLIPGSGSSEIWWENSFDSGTNQIKPITFLSDLKKLGAVYKFTFPWFNLYYYYK